MRCVVPGVAACVAAGGAVCAAEALAAPLAAAILASAAIAAAAIAFWKAARVSRSLPHVASAFVPTPKDEVSASPSPDANSTLPSLGSSATTEGTREACAG